MSWYSTQLTNNQAAAGGQLRLQQLFEEFFIQNRAPRELAMFSHWSEDTDTLIISVTPEVEKYPILIRLLNLQPSVRPPLDATFSVGENSIVGKFCDGEI